MKWTIQTPYLPAFTDWNEPPAAWRGAIKLLNVRLHVLTQKRKNFSCSDIRAQVKQHLSHVIFTCVHSILFWVQSLPLCRFMEGSEKPDEEIWGLCSGFLLKMPKWSNNSCTVKDVWSSCTVKSCLSRCTHKQAAWAVKSWEQTQTPDYSRQPLLRGQPWYFCTHR